MKERNEKLSAFIDGDLHKDEVMSFSLSAEPEDAITVQRYQLAGDALRGELSEASFVDVSAAVREALEGENIADQIAPGTVAADNSTESASGGFLSGLMANWLRPAGGLAVAATVAVVVVTTLSQPETGNNSAGPVIAPIAERSVEPLTAPVRTATIQPQQIQHLENQNLEIQNLENQAISIPVRVQTNNPALNPYINQHLDYASRNAAQGRLPYARSAIYGNNPAAAGLDARTQQVKLQESTPVRSTPVKPLAIQPTDSAQ